MKNIYIFTSINRRIMENYIFRFLILVLLATMGNDIYAQSGPECRSLNMAIESDDSSTLRIADAVPNLAGAIPFTFQLLNSAGAVLQQVYVTGPLSLRIAACQYANRGLTFNAFNNQGSCEGNLTFKVDQTPSIQGHDTMVYCIDPLIYSGMVGSGPEVTAPCSTVEPKINFVADWVKPMPCLPGNDTAKIIYREYEVMGKDGSRSTGFDTIYVKRLPLMTRNNTFCGERDTSYCGDIQQNFGPYMLLPGPAGTPCQRLYLLNPDGSARIFDAKCGLQVSSEELPFESDCGIMKRVTVEIKQSCYGTTANACPDQDVAQNVLTPVGTTPGYWTCDFWSIVLDTTPPVLNCGEKIKIIPASSHDCGADFTLPPVTAADVCGEVVMVKAIVEGWGTYQFFKSGSQWISTDLISISQQNDTIQVIYEAYDQCHNLALDSCGLVIKDRTVPVAVAAKGVNIALGSKKVWVDAQNFDQGSWDNCDIAILLARRTDWKAACIDLCDSLKLVSVTPEGDSIYSPVLNDMDDAEDYYRETLQWLTYDSQYCSQVLLDAWQYDLMRHATVECKAVLDENHFDELVKPLLSPGADFDKVKQLGGGWAPQVPFSCEDVCTTVKVEILVMDYWCNWSKSWSDALVEDKSPIEVAKEISTEISIACRTFKEKRYDHNSNDASIEDLLAAFDQGDQSVLSEFDQIFGTYQKVWRGNDGELIDSNGMALNCDITFIDSMCVCQDSVVADVVFDYHTGTWIDVVDTIRYCQSEDTTKIWSHGALLVNCSDNVHCTQTLWHDLNSCGQGVIYRKWSIWKECQNGAGGHMTAPDTTYKTQEIRIINPDTLDLGKFKLPPDTVLQACALEYDPDGSGNVGGGAHPDSIGSPMYLFDNDCSQIGVGYFDKVFELVDTSRRCHAVIRTWCFIDWCNLGEPTDDWIDNPTYHGSVLKYTQHILICEQL
ncbi:MAG: hypothetical protein HKN76_15430, partial [Saprospiraceae bacterium]|nr:hypothetical protein [Saprospiraceae bacterium]